MKILKYILLICCLTTAIVSSNAQIDSPKKKNPNLNVKTVDPVMVELNLQDTPHVHDCGMLNLRMLDLNGYYDKNSPFNKNLDLLRDRSVEELRNAVNVQQVFQKKKRGPVKRVVSIAAHIFTREDGTGGISDARIEEAIRDANKAFEFHNLTFELCVIDEIKSNGHYNNTNWGGRTASSDYIINQNLDDDFGVEGMLNIFFHKRINGLSYSAFPWWESRKHIVMDDDHIDPDNNSNNEIFIHELGHWFGLLHTFATSRGVGLANGSNCNSTGDLICDTPADINPNNLGVYNPNSCSWTGNLTDANNTPYDPDVNNYMSYYFNCMNKFSLIQSVVILSTILSGRDEFINVGCTGEKGDCVKFNPDNLTIKSFSISGRGTFYELVDGTTSIKTFPNRAEAEKARKVIDQYKANELCGLGYEDFEYLLNNGTSPLNKMEGEDCIQFDPTKLRVARHNGKWKIMEDNYPKFNFGDDQRAATDALLTIQEKGFTYSCYIGRPNASMKYLRKDLLFIPDLKLPFTPIILEGLESGEN